ncbi:MAG: serpin family protein [Candidatus Marinimicrobia bacterium]|nr:serpin family protein [Candidatus Neomarinimicrobiota bacterium]
MKNMLILLTLFTFLLACEFSTDPDKKEVCLNLSGLQKELAATDNVFTFNLFNKLSLEEEGNLFISPLSVSMALGMVYNGAVGDTKTEIAQMLGLSGHSDQEINEYYHKMITLLPKLDDQVKLEIANSIWVREGFSVEPEFLNINIAYFHAEIDNLDFSQTEAAEVINDWVAEATHNKIETIIDEIPGDVIMYLINALYFKGDWTRKFKKSSTFEDNFYCQSGSTKRIDMMYQKENFNYAENDQFQLIDLPYSNEKFSLTIILPKVGHNLTDLNRSLTVSDWYNYLSNAGKKEVELYLPKFELEYKRELSQILHSMGMKSAFEGMLSDFTGINAETGRNLVIDEVMHKTYLKIDEEGSEAAAVTSVGMRITSVMPDEIVMKIDRPFLLAIRERENGTILFIGKITDLEK